jgi:hypothetical protein
MKNKINIQKSLFQHTSTQSIKQIKLTNKNPLFSNIPGLKQRRIPEPKLLKDDWVTQTEWKKR